jgi:hypothetical protein
MARERKLVVVPERNHGEGNGDLNERRSRRFPRLFSCAVRRKDFRRKAHAVPEHDAF